MNIAVLCCDRIIPTGAFTSPALGNVSGVVAVTVNAADNDAVASVRFFVDGASLGAPVTVAPYTVNYDTRALLNGAHTFSAIISDRSGNTLTITRAVTFANAPVVTISSPANGSNVSGTIAFTANVTHYDSTCSTQFKIDGGNYGSAVGGAGALAAPNLNTIPMPNGNHSFSATSTDAHGNTATATVNATISNIPPAVPVTGGPTGTVNSGDVLTGSWSAFWQYGLWAGNGHTLQYRIYLAYEGDDEGKAGEGWALFDDGNGFQVQGAIVYGPGATGYGDIYYYQSGWMNVPVDASHVNLRAIVQCQRDPGGNTYMTFHGSQIDYQWV